jgi:hypothetical protein
LLKFGLLFVLANVFLKLFVGIGIWKMALENKPGFKMESSANYGGEQNEDENQNYSQNDRQGSRIYADGGGSGSKIGLRQSDDGEEVN